MSASQHPLDTPGKGPGMTPAGSLQVGRKEGRVVLGLNEKPIAALHPLQAAAYANLIITEAMRIAFNVDSRMDLLPQAIADGEAARGKADPDKN
jgi:hypothetical protein